MINIFACGNDKSNATHYFEIGSNIFCLNLKLKHKAENG
jgi:hypothetical protein